MTGKKLKITCQIVLWYKNSFCIDCIVENNIKYFKYSETHNLYVHTCIYFQYLERMELLYSGKAREEGVYIVGACGFDSVPSDMGIAYTTSQFQGNVSIIDLTLCEEMDVPMFC